MSDTLEEMYKLSEEELGQVTEDIATFVQLVKARGQMSKSLANSQPDYIKKMCKHYEDYASHYVALTDLAQRNLSGETVAQIKRVAMKRQFSKIIQYFAK